MDHYCENCGKLIKKTGNRRKYPSYCAECSRNKVRNDKIRLRLKKLAGFDKVCDQCGKPFNTKYERARFCSHVCRNEYHYIKEPRTKTCKQCGKPFETSDNTRLYCCKECYHQGKLDRLRAAEKAKKEANAIIS